MNSGDNHSMICLHIKDLVSAMFVSTIGLPEPFPIRQRRSAIIYGNNIEPNLQHVYDPIDF